MKRSRLWLGSVFVVACSTSTTEVPRPDEEQEELGQVESALAGDCAAPSLTASPSGGLPTPGGIVMLGSTSATCMGGAAPLYRFVDGSQVLCDWQSSQSCPWSTASTNEGIHLLRVEVRRHNASAANAEGRSAPTRYVVGRICRSVAVTSAPTWVAGAPVSVIASPTCDAGADAVYKLDVTLPDGTRALSGAWQDSPNWSFALPSGSRPGQGRYTVSVRQRGSAVVETAKTATYWLGLNSCRASLSAKLQTGYVRLSAPEGTVLCSGGSASFKFSEIAPNGATTVLQDFSPSSTFDFPAGARNGVYRYVLDVIGSGSPTQVPIRAQSTLKLGGTCTSADVITHANITIGGSIALHATATGCPAEFTYRYRASTSRTWIPIDCTGALGRPVNPWAGMSCWWNTTGLTPGEYKLSVIARSSGATAVASEVTSVEETSLLDSEDTDGDGYTPATGDCWEGNPTVHPGATETCNDVDDNCDGVIDNGLARDAYYRDFDGDGVGRSDAHQLMCQGRMGWTLFSGDCDDANALRYPGAAETCNGIDDDCDGVVDDGASATCGSGMTCTAGLCVPAAACTPGTPGTDLWTRHFEPNERSEGAYAVSAGPSGNVAIAGMGTRQFFYPYGGVSEIEDGFVRAYDTAGVEQWTRRFGITGTDAVTIARSVRIDSSGNVLVGGEIQGGAFAGQTAVGVGATNAFVRKYDASGIELWTRQFGSGALDHVYGLSSDDSGNILVVGDTRGALPGQTQTTGSDGFVRKYGPSGNELWTRQFAGPNAFTVSRAVSVDGSGNVFVAGFVGGALPGQTHAGNGDAFVRKYDASGTELWTRQFGTFDQDYAYGVSTDSDGNVLVGGDMGVFAFVRKYDSSGGELWTRQFGSSAKVHVYGVSADSTGKVFVGGTINTATLPGEPKYDAFVRSYDATGTELWNHAFGTTANDTARAVSANANGSVFVAGETGGAFPGYSNPGTGDAFVRKIDACMPSP